MKLNRNVGPLQSAHVERDVLHAGQKEWKWRHILPAEAKPAIRAIAVSYTHLRAHETLMNL
eukprot:6682522-Prymnesium_polylepis.3